MNDGVWRVVFCVLGFDLGSICEGGENNNEAVFWWIAMWVLQAARQQIKWLSEKLSLGIQVAEGDWQEITVQCMIFVYIYWNARYLSQSCYSTSFLTNVLCVFVAKLLLCSYKNCYLRKTLLVSVVLIHLVFVKSIKETCDRIHLLCCFVF